MATATATQAIIEAPAVNSGLPSTLLMDSEATALVTAYQSLRKHGLEFGRLCYNFRKRSKVVSGGTTFDSTLDRLDIPRSSAYRWIARYEESIGVREPDAPKPKIAEKKPVQSVVPESVSQTRCPYCKKELQIGEEHLWTRIDGVTTWCSACPIPKGLELVKQGDNIVMLQPPVKTPTNQTDDQNSEGAPFCKKDTGPYSCPRYELGRESKLQPVTLYLKRAWEKAAELREVLFSYHRNADMVVPHNTLIATPGFLKSPNGESEAEIEFWSPKILVDEGMTARNEGNGDEPVFHLRLCRLTEAQIRAIAKALKSTPTPEPDPTPAAEPEEGL